MGQSFCVLIIGVGGVLISGVMYFGLEFMDMHNAGRNSAAILGGKKTRCGEIRNLHDLSSCKSYRHVLVIPRLCWVHGDILECQEAIY